MAALHYGPEAIEDPVLPFWREALGISRWPGEDVFTSLYRAFVGSVEISDGAARALADGPVIFIANHQVAIESLIFVFALGGIGRRHIRALAKEAHQTSWVGELLGLLHAYPGQVPAPPSFFRDEYDPQSLVDMLAEMRRALTSDGHSLLIHAEGARVLDCRRSVAQVSSVFVDLARETGKPIIPVRFSGALPVETMDNYLDFPFAFCPQTYHLGEPVTAQDLAAAHPRDRRPMVTAAINATGSPAAEEVPGAPNLAFRRGVQKFMSETATSQVKAVLVTALRALDAPLDDTRRVLASLDSGSMVVGEGAGEEWLGQFCGWLSDGRSRLRRLPGRERAAI
jgi:1-acyl-sn-glycerol-3-phosphate acyltransferase